MVVNDSEDIRELLRMQLTRLGYRVVEAAAGREAVEAVLLERHLGDGRARRQSLVENCQPKTSTRQRR